LAVVTVGDWVCGCGQRYRVLIEDDAVRMWPECATGDFREQPLDGHCGCGGPIDAALVASALTPSVA
jgi:hypothetical protein